MGVAEYVETLLQSAVEAVGRHAVSAVLGRFVSDASMALVGEAGETLGRSFAPIWRTCSRSTAGIAGLAATIGRRSGNALARYSSTSGSVLGSAARRSSSGVWAGTNRMIGL